MAATHVSKSDSLSVAGLGAKEHVLVLMRPDYVKALDI